MNAESFSGDDSSQTSCQAILTVFRPDLQFYSCINTTQGDKKLQSFNFAMVISPH